MAVERKYERDIDILLAEEFSVNPEFAFWMGSKTLLGNEEAIVADVFVSKSDNLGESDLIVLFERVDGRRFALLHFPFRKARREVGGELRKIPPKLRLQGDGPISVMGGKADIRPKHQSSKSSSPGTLFV